MHSHVAGTLRKQASNQPTNQPTNQPINQSWWSCRSTPSRGAQQADKRTKALTATAEKRWSPSRPLYSGCQQDTVACEHTWSELASWTLHSAIAKKQNRRSTTSSRTVPSGGNRHQMSQPPTSCWVWCLFVACLTSQQHASVSQGRICTDNSTCCHT